MDADNTHSAISISPTIIELPQYRTVLNSIFVKALLLVQEHAPPPPTTQIASLSLTGDKKKSRNEPKQETDTITQPTFTQLQPDTATPSVTSTQDISSITGSQADGHEHEEDPVAELQPQNSDHIQLIEALHPTIYDVCTNLLLVSGIPTDMIAETVLQNI
jgi:hypothetical protein